jgi:hypothetical protein
MLLLAHKHGRILALPESIVFVDGASEVHLIANVVAASIGVL